MLSVQIVNLSADKSSSRKVTSRVFSALALCYLSFVTLCQAHAIPDQSPCPACYLPECVISFDDLRVFPFFSSTTMPVISLLNLCCSILSISKFSPKVFISVISTSVPARVRVVLCSYIRQPSRKSVDRIFPGYGPQYFERISPFL